MTENNELDSFYDLHKSTFLEVTFTQNCCADSSAGIVKCESEVSLERSFSVSALFAPRPRNISELP